MGRQYNYFISPEEELDFMEKLFDNNFLILKPQEVTRENIIVWEWEVLQLHDILRKNHEKFCMPSRTYIYKKEWGELKNNQKTYFSLVDKCPIIEHCHCSINEEYNSLSSGRFYLDTSNKDEIESFNIVCKGFQKLIRMMKKKIVYKSYEYVFENGKTMHWPSSQQAVELIKSGYKIGL